MFQWTFVISYLEPSTVPLHWGTFFFSLFLRLSPQLRFCHLPIDWYLQELPGYLQATLCLQNIESDEFSKFSLNSHLLSHLSAPQPTVACFLLSINSGPNSSPWFSNLPTITLSTQIYFTQGKEFDSFVLIRKKRKVKKEVFFSGMCQSVSLLIFFIILDWC